MLNALKSVVPRSVKNKLRRSLENIRLSQQFSHAAKQGTHPVFIFQPGKVGSMSIYRSLKKVYAGPVIHAHSFGPEDKDYAVRRLYRWHKQGKPLFLISLTREPIGRNVSSFFENYERYTGVSPKNSSLTVQQLGELYLQQFGANGAAEWFDEFLVGKFGIEPLKLPLQPPGIQRATVGNVEFLFMKAELSDDEKVAALKALLPLQHFSLGNENVGERKDYAASYKAFKEQIRFSSEYVESILQNPYSTYFYSEAERAEMRRKWLIQE